MNECNHIYTLGVEAGTSAVLNDRCCICGNQAANPTLQPFDKMQPGEVDKIFQAACPKCDGRVWVFTDIDTRSHSVANPDARRCKNCGYVHWLRGPNTSEVVPLRRIEPLETPKKDRVRALVFALIAAPASYTYYDEDGNRRALRVKAGEEFSGWNSVMKVAEEIDREIEAIK